jgi:hypothetical protein
MGLQIAGLIVVLLFCVAVGVGVYWLLVRPFTLPLEKKIPTGRAYRAGVVPRKSARYG